MTLVIALAKTEELQRRPEIKELEDDVADMGVIFHVIEIVEE